MVIRNMQEEDVSSVAEIEKEIFSMPWTEQGFQSALEQDTCFVVAEEERILGYCGAYVSFDEAEITNVAVKKDSQGNGVGGRLLEDLEARLEKRGVKRIVLEVRYSNEPAIHLYEKKGYKKLGIRKNFYQNPREDAWMMERQID